VPNEGDELAPDRTVLRLVRNVPVFVPDGMRFPTGDAFRPSESDKKEAETRGRPVRVSVWDLCITTIPQARSFRATNDLQRSFALRVANIIKIQTQMSEPRLRAVSDPRPDHEGPGAAGHCGIEGLDRPPQGRKVIQRALLDALAREVVEVDDGGMPIEQKR